MAKRWPAALAGAAQAGEVLPHKAKVLGLIPAGHAPRLRVQSPDGGHVRRQPMDASLSHLFFSFSLPLPRTLKAIKTDLRSGQGNGRPL